MLSYSKGHEAPLFEGTITDALPSQEADVPPCPFVSRILAPGDHTEDVNIRLGYYGSLVFAQQQISTVLHLP